MADRLGSPKVKVIDMAKATPKARPAKAARPSRDEKTGTHDGASA